MRALLMLAVLVCSLLTPADAGAGFNCFDTPQGERRCACIGANACDELQQSDSCQSDLKCDKGELGAVVCSCRATRDAKPRP
jgi:hypothetical protein